MGKVRKFKLGQVEEGTTRSKKSTPVGPPLVPIFPENSFSLVQISKGGRARVGQQDRVRTEGGAGGP
jgi:hypothetical protein